MQSTAVSKSWSDIVQKKAEEGFFIHGGFLAGQQKCYNIFFQNILPRPNGQKKDVKTDFSSTPHSTQCSNICKKVQFLEKFSMEVEMK